MRFLVAIATVAVLLAGVAATHQHAASGGAHECVACTVGGSLEARDATPTLAPPTSAPVAQASVPAADPVTGFPLGRRPRAVPSARLAASVLAASRISHARSRARRIYIW